MKINLLLLYLIFLTRLNGQDIDYHDSGNGYAYEINVAEKTFDCIVSYCISNMIRTNFITESTEYNEAYLYSIIDSLIDNEIKGYSLNRKIFRFDPTVSNLFFYRTFYYSSNKEQPIIQIKLELKYDGGLLMASKINIIEKDFINTSEKFLKYYYLKSAGSRTNIPFPPDPPEIEWLLYSSRGLDLCPDCKRKKLITLDNETRKYWLNEKEEFELLKILGEGLILAKKNNLYGIINYENKQIIPLEYDQLDVISNYCIIAWKDNKCGVLDFNGDSIIPIEFDNIKFNTVYYRVKKQKLSSQFIVEKDNQFGVFNNKGNVLIPVIYSKLELFHSKYYKAKKDDSYGVISSKGKILTDFIYKEINFENFNHIISFEVIDVEGNKKRMAIINQKDTSSVKEIIFK